MIVEDNPDLNLYLSDQLKKYGFQVSTQSNGRDALGFLEKQHPDLIISDVMMPEVNGLELLNQVKQDFNTCHIPIILLTAKASSANKMEGLEFGADDYLTKPFNLNELMIRGKNLIRQRRQLKESFIRNPFNRPKQPKLNQLDEKFLKSALYKKILKI